MYILDKESKGAHGGMDRKLLQLWLTSKNAITPTKIMLLQDYFGGVEAIYAACEEEYEAIGELSHAMIVALCDKSLETAKRVFYDCVEQGIRILTCYDEDFPTCLTKISSPVSVLYAKGTLPDWDNMLGIAVVGTRRCSEYGHMVAERISHELAAAGVTIISGMARGIDSVAGITAIKCGGKTVAVLGSGIDVIYPPEHAELYDKIRKNGVVMTEYPPGTRPLRENFPRRNRIMAGLSYGILVTQAPEKSGALITASYAVENGRDLYAVPADIFNINSVGSNRLIKQGAKPVITADDIINEYPYLEIIPLSEKRTEEKQRDKLKDLDLSALNDLQIKIVKELNNEPLHIDEIARITGVASFEINSELVMLELQGIVTKLNGNIYELN